MLISVDVSTKVLTQVQSVVVRLSVQDIEIITEALKYNHAANSSIVCDFVELLKRIEKFTVSKHSDDTVVVK